MTSLLNILHSATTTPPNGIANDNRWTNPSAVPGSIPVNGLGGFATPNFYVRALQGTYPWSPLLTSMVPIGAIAVPSSTVSPLYVPLAPTTCPNICYNPPCLHTAMAKIARNEIPFNSATGNEKFMLQHGLLKAILADTTVDADTTSDATDLRYFRDTTLAFTEMGKIAIVSDSIAGGDTTYAKAINLLIVPTKCAEEYHKIVNNIYLRSWARNQFFQTSADSITLDTIAHQDPLFCGTAIYDARVMLGLDLNDYSPETKKQEFFEGKVIEGKIGILYPNPAATSCIYEAELSENSIGRVEMFNINGELLQTFKLTEGYNKLEIDLLPYQNGVYMFKVIVDNDVTETKRLVIAR